MISGFIVSCGLSRYYVRYFFAIFIVCVIITFFISSRVLVEPNNLLYLSRVVSEPKLPPEVQYQPPDKGPLPVATDERPSEPEVPSVQKERHKILYDACETLGLNKYGRRVHASEFLIDKKNGLVWCNVFKAASTSWVDYLLRLRGYDDPKAAAKKLKKMHVMHLLRDTDKLEGQQKGWRASLQREIKRLLPHPPSGPPSFEDFVNSIILAEKKSKQHNEHWIQYHKFCTPCQFNFTVILKKETFDEDAATILKAAHLPPENLRPQNVQKHGTTSSNITKQYFDNIPLQTIQKLYNVYKADFLLFNYSADEYLKPTEEEQSKRTTN